MDTVPVELLPQFCTDPATAAALAAVCARFSGMRRRFFKFSYKHPVIRVENGQYATECNLGKVLRKYQPGVDTLVFVTSHGRATMHRVSDYDVTWLRRIHASVRGGIFELFECTSKYTSVLLGLTRRCVHPLKDRTGALMLNNATRMSLNLINGIQTDIYEELTWFVGERAVGNTDSIVCALYKKIV